MSSSSEISSPLLALSNNLADIVEKAGQSVVAVNGRRRFSSSGIHWQPGIIVTANQSLKRSEEITVILADGRNVSAILAGRDPSTDLAVLKLEEARLPVAEIGDSSSLKVGHIALALGLSRENGLSASMGVISAIGGPWHSWYGGLIDQFVRLDLSLYPGFSGGPLVETTGKVVGINTSGPRRVTLTIPAITINRVVKQLLEDGQILQGYLGIGMQPVHLPTSLQKSLSLSSEVGVIVVSVEANAPADQAGLLIGDVLVAIENSPVNDTSDVQAKLGQESIGKTLKVELIRGGKLIELAIAPCERPGRE